METLIGKVRTTHTPRSLGASVRECGGLVLLESTSQALEHGRYSLVTVEPRRTFRSVGARCEFFEGGERHVNFGNPWRIIEEWLEAHESPADELLPYPAGGVFGFWGYELRQFVEAKLRPHPVPDGVTPDCWLGFYDSLVVFDRCQGDAWIISTGRDPDGGWCAGRARERFEFWSAALQSTPAFKSGGDALGAEGLVRAPHRGLLRPGLNVSAGAEAGGSIAGHGYGDWVRRAQRYIRSGDIYQVNLARRWWAECQVDPWAFYCELAARSPAPFAAFIETDDFALASASPELFLRLDGGQILTRPIKGTRPRGDAASEDSVLAAELLRSTKERAELTMITDLLRNDLGKVCEYGSIRVPELARLERYAQVQHLVSTVTGRLREEVTHLAALESCFPGGSVTGAPKFRAMQIIDEIEPVGRGPYTGCLGYLGFNRRSQLSIIIRAAVCGKDAVWFHGGAGIVADSVPEAEHLEVLLKVNSLRETLDNRRSSRAHLGALSLSRVAGEQ